MTIDRYTKFIITLLTIGVWVLALAIIFQPSTTQASEDMDVNIETIGGSYVSGALPVEIRGTVSIEFDEEPVFEISN